MKIETRMNQMMMICLIAVIAITLSSIFVTSTGLIPINHHQTTPSTPMLPITAICFLSISTSLLYLRKETPQKGILILLLILHTVLIIFSAVDIAIYSIGSHTDYIACPYNNLLKGSDSFFISPPCCTMFILFSLLVILEAIPKISGSSGMKTRKVIHYLSSLLIILSIPFLFTYLFNTPFHTNGSSSLIPMTFPSALGFVLLSSSYRFYLYETFPMKVYIHQSTKHAILRYLMAFSTSVIIISVYSTLLTSKNTKIPVAVIAACMVMVSALIAAGIASILSKKLGSEIDALRLIEMQAKQDAQERENFLKIILNSIDDTVLVTDTRGIITHVNPAAHALLGICEDEILHNPTLDILHIVDESTGIPIEPPAKQVIDSGKSHSGTKQLILVSGEKHIPITYTSAPILNKGILNGVVLVIHDMTEMTLLNSEILRSTKQDTLRALSGGIAHDFNNLLNGIFGNIELAQLQMEQEESIQNYLDNAMKVFDRARALTQQLLSFSKDQPLCLIPHDLNTIVKESTCFALSGSSTKVSFDLDEELALSPVDKHRIDQVIDNLVINAKQAMAEKGSITIMSKNCFIPASSQIPLPAGDYVHLSISDAGPGIPQEVLKQVFEPFFTTKEHGHGLGLANCYQIISRHDGHISVDSIPGLGTTFHIYLPAARLKESASAIV